jgi:hypothetical protein
VGKAFYAKIISNFIFTLPTLQINKLTGVKIMNQLITVTFDGEVLKPEIPLNLEVNQQYQIQLISNNNDNNLEISANLYAQIYQEDEELQELTEAACADFIE